MKKYLDATPEAGNEFYQDFHDKGKIVMLNLLRFRAQADYTGLESIKPPGEVTGREAYHLYMEAVLPTLRKAGGNVLFYGKGKQFLIGPEVEKWDVVLLVEYPSVAEFVALAQSEDYLKIAGHRTASLEDSRLLPISQKRI